MKKLILLLVLVSLVFSIDDMTIPNTFTAGTKAVASDVNENFDSSETAVNRIVDSIQNDYPRKSDYLSSGDSSFSSFRVDTLPDAVIIDSATFGTVLDGGTVTTVDINGGTIDGTTIGAVSATTGVFTVVTSDTTRPVFVRGNPIIDSAAIANLDPDTVQAFTLLGKLTAGANEIEGSAFDINGGTIDGVTIGGSAAPTVTDLGTVTTCDINGGTIDGVTIGGSAAPTVTDLGTVTTCDINGGAIDGTVIGASSASTASFSQIGVGTGNFTNGNITTCDINGGAIDGVTIGDASASTGDFTEVLVQTHQNAATSLTVKNDAGGTSACSRVVVESNATHCIFGAYDDAFTDIPEWTDKTILNTYNSTALLLGNSDVAGVIEFYAGGTAAANKRMTIDSGGGVFMYNMKSGTTQANAGAAADELWVDTDDANTIKLGT